MAESLFIKFAFIACRQYPPDAAIHVKRQGTSFDPYRIAGSGKPEKNMDIAWFLAYMQSAEAEYISQQGQFYVSYPFFN